MIDGDAEILFNHQVNHDTWLLGLKRSEPAVTMKPGQFVMIRVRSGMDPLLRRPFSVCAVEKDHFKVLYRRVGKGTEIMTQAKPGENFQVLGPLGEGFVLPEEERLPVLVGGGIGVAPLFFLARLLYRRNLEFMMGFRSAGDIIPFDELRLPNHRWSVSTDDGTAGHAGFVTDLLLLYLDKNRGLPLSLFACGPRPMLKKTAETAITYGIPCQVSLESAMACGFGVCQGCAVKTAPQESSAYHYVCRNGPVFPAEAIDWEAL
ncbi:MAG: dihydroorotate dehydrogenase electron transfer subunit [Deltaproteobacteria bacterium]|nr:dihydroorotate dehydrogenase electron transfer subunit [Deltaproteobacteria bacterium]